MMTNNEVNKVIAEYMGYKYQLINAVLDSWWVHVETKKWLKDEYTNSLDALVPVWEKLDTQMQLTFDKSGGILL